MGEDHFARLRTTLSRIVIFLSILFKNPGVPRQKKIGSIVVKNYVPYSRCHVIFGSARNYHGKARNCHRAELSSAETQGGWCDDLPNCRWRTHRIRTLARATHTRTSPSSSVPLCLSPDTVHLASRIYPKAIRFRIVAIRSDVSVAQIRDE